MVAERLDMMSDVLSEAYLAQHRDVLSHPMKSAADCFQCLFILVVKACSEVDVLVDIASGLPSHFGSIQAASYP